MKFSSRRTAQSWSGGTTGESPTTTASHVIAKIRYIAGSIVRVKITGFMTYDHVEFRPGPHLNMILGPNGTGKSSIAAAIAIGLGFHPKVWWSPSSKGAKEGR